ncbi:MAG TPA: nucleotidyltransferase family protein [Candidatus Brocadiia bacterium]|nr:nucleotidyltransferase family protein [Planctomycetota bacterium]MDO8091913.1 nucleotidyltransferase family protein [Candidatus Brocadiales bacterium]
MKTKKLTEKVILDTLTEQKEILKKYGVKRIGLFGSFVRGEQKEYSDIDFLVEFEKPSFDNFMDLAFYLEDLFGRKVKLITNGSLSPYIQPYVEKEIKWYETEDRRLRVKGSL